MSRWKLTSMSKDSRTPQDLDIRLRDYRFGRETGTHPRWWLNGDPIATAFFNALSATFPQGERFFMDSVKAFRGEVSGELREQVAAFLFQESMHTREHVVFNEIATKAGFAMKPLEARTGRRLAFARKRPKIDQLAATCALEHFTAILAHALLADRRYLEGAPREAYDLWVWHAMEEVEHKAVAFDTYNEVMKSQHPLQRYRKRVRAMVIATVIFAAAIAGNLRDLFRQDGTNNLGTWLKLGGYLLFKPGLLRRIAGDYFAYYKPGFHPWDHDDRELLAVAERELEGRAAVGVAA